MNHLLLLQEIGRSIKCKRCNLHFPFEDFQREHRRRLNCCILCRASNRNSKRVEMEKTAKKVLRPKKNQEANIPQIPEYHLSVPHVCPKCRYTMCAYRKICRSCSVKTHEKITRNKLELKIKAIPFKGPDINADLIKSQEIETFQYKYVVDYIFEENITRLSKNGLVPQEPNNPIPGSITLENCKLSLQMG